jgi:hypothetical protein
MSDQVFLVLGSIVALAVIAVLIVNGDKTAHVIATAGNSFVNALNAATHPYQAQ